MIQVEVIQSRDEGSFVDAVNYFLEKLAPHLFVDIQYKPLLLAQEQEAILYQALILYRVE